MMKSVKISDKVYRTDFQLSAMGYDAIQVDKFLDQVNQDIVDLERINAELCSKLEELKKQLAKEQNKSEELSLRVNQLQATRPMVGTGNFNNIELIERIANLEKMVQHLTDLLQNK